MDSKVSPAVNESREIEETLRGQLGKRCQRLSEPELQALSISGAVAGWRIAIQPGELLAPEVTYFDLTIDRAFPASQIRVTVPPTCNDLDWPHLEPTGNICSFKTRVSASAGERALQQLVWAQQVFNLDAGMRTLEFSRELSAYWDRHADISLHFPEILSCLQANGPGRMIAWCQHPKRPQLVVAESNEQLKTWMSNKGVRLRDKNCFATYLVWLDSPWLPSEFPRYGSQVMQHLPPDVLGDVIRLDRGVPIVFGATTETGPVLVACILQGASEKQITKGFRSIKQVPSTHIVRSFAKRPAVRLPVQRVDGSWVHGRDHNRQFELLQSKHVVLVGAGSLGGYTARLLAQAGVGTFTIVDADTFHSHNTSRHILGHGAIGEKKAVALSDLLKTDFPHVLKTTAIASKMIGVSDQTRAAIAEGDLILSCGISLEGDLQIDQLRDDVANSPKHLCSWIEAYGLVGHGLLLAGPDRFRDAVRPDESNICRVTRWPEGDQTQIEAGCGNEFQPHGAIDLQATVSLVAELALKSLLENPQRSERWTCYGSRQEALRLGAELSSEFSHSHRRNTFSWPDNEQNSDE